MDIYEKYHAQRFEYGGKKLDFVLVPRKYLTQIILADSGFSLDRKLIVNSAIDIPIAGEEHWYRLGLTKAATVLIELRKSLEPGMLQSCYDIPVRAKGRLKMIRFIQGYLHLDNSAIEPVQLPERYSMQELKDALITTNLNANRLIENYVHQRL
jgi:hypothetical protein